MVKEKVIEVVKLKKYFKERNKNVLKAVDDISFTLYEGEVLGLIGESGCGKSTIARTIVGYYKPTEGKVLYKGQNIHQFNKKQLKNYTKEAQMIFQDPSNSLDPRMRIVDIVGEGIDIHRIASGDERLDRIYKVLNDVGLNRSLIYRFPHEFSGGQKQRISIARALALEPRLLICDEPISALDVSIRVQIVNLLKRLQKNYKLTYLFITHDLSTLKYIANRVAIMYRGSLLEIATTEDIYRNPLHPYTKVLLSSIPIPDPDVEKNRDIEILGNRKFQKMSEGGCKFRGLCKYSKKICFEIEPCFNEIDSDHFVRCHLY